MDTMYAICGANGIPNRRGRAFSLLRLKDGKEEPWHIFVVRWDGEFFGYVNRCPHEGVNLDWERGQFLEQGGRRIVCGKHGSLFELASGLCVEGRCVGEKLEPVALCVDEDDLCVMGVTLAEDGE